MPTTDDTPAKEYGEVKVIKDKPPPKPMDQAPQPTEPPKKPETPDTLKS